MPASTMQGRGHTGHPRRSRERMTRPATTRDTAGGRTTKDKTRLRVATARGMARRIHGRESHGSTQGLHGQARPVNETQGTIRRGVPWLGQASATHGQTIQRPVKTPLQCHCGDTYRHFIGRLPKTFVCRSRSSTILPLETVDMICAEASATIGSDDAADLLMIWDRDGITHITF